MRLRQLAQHRIATGTPGTSLRPLSARETRQVAGALYYGDQYYFPPMPPSQGGPLAHGPAPDPFVP